MRDNWYGDNRDIVKWAGMFLLARQNRARTIVQMAFYRAYDAPPEIILNAADGDRREPVPPEVLAHFRCMDQIRCLQPPDGARIVPLLHKWARDRSAYIQETINNLHELQAPLVVLLDPDTGIAPTLRSMKHVGEIEVRGIFDALNRGEVLRVFADVSRLLQTRLGTAYLLS